MSKKIRVSGETAANLFLGALESIGEDVTEIREEFNLPKTEETVIVAEEGISEVVEKEIEKVNKKATKKAKEIVEQDNTKVQEIVEEVKEKKLKEAKVQLVLCNIEGVDYLFETHLPIKSAQKLLSQKAKSIFVTPKDKYINRKDNEDFSRNYAKQIGRMEVLEIMETLLEDYIETISK